MVNGPDLTAAPAPAATAAPPRLAAPARLAYRIRESIAHARLEYIYLVIALGWGVTQVFLVPPLQTPDEGDHWFRAWAMTDGQLTADREGMLTLPGSFAGVVTLYTDLLGPDRSAALPISLEGQPGFTGYASLFDGPGTSASVRVESRVASYGPIGYMPQAIGVAIGRVAGASSLADFYLARLANLLACVGLIFFAIRLAPFGKQLFMLLALLPMTMLELASVSVDALTIAGAMFFIALALRASTRPTLHRIDIVLVLASSAVLLNVKPGYWALIFLVLLIRPRQLGGIGRYIAFVAANVLLVAGVSLAVIAMTATTARTGGASVASAQLSFIIHDPLAFGAILLANIQGRLSAWVIESMGALGWLSIQLSPLAYTVILMAGIACFAFMREVVAVAAWQRFLMAAIAVAVFLTMAVALYAFLEPLGSWRIFFQGRYLVPVWLLLLLSVYGLWFSRVRLGRGFLVASLLLVMALNLQTIVTYYGA